MGCPPLSVGAVHDNETDVAVFPVNETPLGAVGTLAGVAFTTDENVLVPSMVVCATRN